MASSRDLKQRTAIARLVLKALEQATPIQQYGRLRKGYRFTVTGKQVTIYNVYYWTRFANDGRRPINLRGKRAVMIFFLDPDDDPRWVRDWPRKRAGIRPLSSAEVRQGKRDGTIVIAKKVKGVEPVRFLEKGIQQARKIIPAEMRRFIQGETRRAIRRGRDSVRVRF